MLGQLYKQALEAKGYKVNYKENIGADRDHRQGADLQADRRLPGVHRRVAVRRLQAGRALQEPRGDPADVKDLYEKRGEAVSDPTPFQDTDAIATTKEFADEEQPQLGGRPQEHPDVHARRPAGVQEPLQRPQGHGAGVRRSRTTSSSSSSRSACSTRRSTRATSTRRTCSRPTRSWPRASTRCWRTRRASSASRTSTSSSTRTSSTRSAAMTSWTSSTRSTSC